MGKYKFKITESKPHEVDRNFVDENGEIIAAANRKPNRKFDIVTYFKRNNDEKIEADTLIETYPLIRKLLREIGIDADFQ